MPAKKTPTDASKTKKAISVGHDQIMQRAEEIYQERLAKGQPGTEEGDWLEAERQLLNQM